MKIYRGVSAIAFALLIVTINCNWVDPKDDSSLIADYQQGALLNFPAFVTQPYYLAAKSSCPIIDRPVCGQDGKTYQNECFLDLAKVQKAYEGWCLGSSNTQPPAPINQDPFAEIQEYGFERWGTPAPGICPCNDNYYPVCGKSGTTYANLCRAKCNGDQAVHIGECGNFYYKFVPNTICKCPFTLDKVCATNGVTYENPCVMGCDRASFSAVSVCSRPCDCHFLYKPVCGADGRNYLNACEIKCAMVIQAFEGRCENIANQKCLYCLGDISPICGQDGKTYNNICFMKCNKAEFKYQGKCLPPSPTGACVCPQIYLPVCAKGVTYPNECLARCANATISFNGVCPKRKSRRRSRRRDSSKYDHSYTSDHSVLDQKASYSKKSMVLMVGDTAK